MLAAFIIEKIAKPRIEQLWFLYKMDSFFIDTIWLGNQKSQRYELLSKLCSVFIKINVHLLNGSLLKRSLRS